CYKVEKGLLRFSTLFDFHPMDCWALTKDGKYKGVSVHGQGPSGYHARGAVRLWGPQRWPAKGLWLWHKRRLSRWYGLSQLYGAWLPWRRLAAKDGAEEVQDGAFYRLGYQGPLVRFNPNDF